VIVSEGCDTAALGVVFIIFGRSVVCRLFFLYLYKIKSNKPKHDEEDLNFVGDIGTLCSIDDGPKCD
jgi:hypothetical protein